MEDFLKEHPEYQESRLKTTRYIGAMLPFINELSFPLNAPKISEFRRLVEQEKKEPFRGIIERYHFLPKFGKKVEILSPIDNIDQWELLD